MKGLKILFCGIVITGMFSCVPLKQFQDLEGKYDSNKGELRAMQDENESLEVSNREFSSEIEGLKEEVLQLEKDTLRLAKKVWSLENRNKELAGQYGDFLEDFANNNKDQSSGELLKHLQSLHEELQKREDELAEYERELEKKRQGLELAKSDLDQMQSELELRNKRLFELESALSEKDSLMNALKQTVADALTGFSDEELEVHIKNGKVYVSMEEKLLFSSGSYQVSAIGIGALGKIAGVLESKKDINVLVEGHTDDVPYKSTVLLDNWDLSVKRATSVTRILLQGQNIDPSRITAAGRSEYVPVKKGKTPEARKKNRRTEIILSPNLDQIFNILETN
ncbi:OmpA/MotB family protein [Plebeiibacterium marinum]|uniref:OmpA family protein n=1 Tax=Plebeiibacterium marinum TaxID=2992111 RepID=A0AAE3SKT8_9BACT|nr:OmpA family protein [Plebeiobacterium marinum]MCW3805870.1 OmpA family protein [Plebeiobacterium marinum]